jgi:hypothetical protein
MARPLRGHRDGEHHEQTGGDHPHEVGEPAQPWHVHWSVTPAVATIPVPMTEANQFGPKFCSRAISVVMAQHRVTRVLRWIACE